MPQTANAAAAAAASSPSRMISLQQTIDSTFAKLTEAGMAPLHATSLRGSLHAGEWCSLQESGVADSVDPFHTVPRLSAFDKNDVKVQVKVEGDGVEKSKQHTTTIEDGGGDCQWAHGRGESLLFIAAAAPTEMTIEAIDEDTGSR